MQVAEGPRMALPSSGELPHSEHSLREGDSQYGVFDLSAVAWLCSPLLLLHLHPWIGSQSGALSGRLLVAFSPSLGRVLGA